MRLHRTSQRARDKKRGVSSGLGGRALCSHGEAAREADANSRAASPRGCTRQRKKPLAGEPRG